MAKQTKHDLFDSESASDQGPVECLGITFPSDEARRAHFTEKLRETLKDKAFRKIEGFPIGDDDDILALSDPPYYTACPNPFLKEFISSGPTPPTTADEYECEPYAADVSEGKNDAIYNAHSYHTKVPHKAIMRYILHYTQPGDLVFDGFCGTGMTGVAAQACGHPDPDFQQSVEQEYPQVQWGARRCLLCDLSVLPTFIASNLNQSLDPLTIENMFLKLLKEAEGHYGSFFETSHSGKAKGTVNYAVWSDVFICPNCSNEVVFWDAAVDLKTGEQSDPFPCPHCETSLKKRVLDRAFSQVHDPITKKVERRAKRKMVWINYFYSGTRHTKKPNADDLKKAEELAGQMPAAWVPSSEIPKQDRFYKDGLHLVSLTHYHLLYFPRALHVLGYLWSRIETEAQSVATRNALRFILTSMIDRNLTIRNRFVVNQHNPQGRINGPLANTLYVPGLSVEQNPFEALAYKCRDVVAAFRMRSRSHCITTQSLSSLELPPNCVDYIFVDPPFGHNIMYSELNGVTESWLRVSTANRREAVVSEKQAKGVTEYMSLMEACFQRCFSALKPGRWMTVEFHNSKNSIWLAIQEAIGRAGFVVADVRTLDKKKGTINQEFYTAGAVKQDLVITAYKPTKALEERFSLGSGTEDAMWEFVRCHLGQIPIHAEKNGCIQVIAERQNYLLFDRMVAFHVQRGVTVPLSAGEFYAGLRERYPERDGMYFLSEQVGEYDRKRLEVTQVEQQQLFVSDEKSAIQWVRRQLSNDVMSYQQLSPLYMQEAQRVWEKHEQPLELRTILEQNFVEEGNGKWCIPDPKNELHLEQLRHRALMKEFQQYLDTKGKLKIVRTEALRAGFKDAWQKKDYPTIVQLAKRIPDAVIEEDQALLMYFDNASLMLGE
jgi:DNA modification methylase